MFREDPYEDETIEYSSDKALAYWLKIEPDEVIYDPSFELLSINGHVKAYITSWLQINSEKSLLPNDKIALTQSMQSVCNTQLEINYLLDAIYLYAANRQKKNRLLQHGKLLTPSDMRFPDGHAECTNDIPAWYKKDPIEFLLIITPIAQNKVFYSHTIIKKIDEEPNLDRIILSTITLSNGEQSHLTFKAIVHGLFKTYSIVKEGLFLISSYAQNYKKDKTV